MPRAGRSERCVDKDEDFMFKNLQRIQYLEENANKVAPVFEANIDILTELKDHCQSILVSKDCPDELQVGCRIEFA